MRNAAHAGNQEGTMRQALVGVLTGFGILAVFAMGIASAEECSGMISAAEAVKAEDARYAAQTANDFAAMEKLFGSELVYQHSSAAVDNKTTYIGAMKSGKSRYRTMKRNDESVRTFGCLAIMSGTAEYGVGNPGQERTVPLRFTAIWAKRPDGTVQFVSWQATGIPVKQ
jgi:ketosteroid isomerase-like protein